MKRVTEVKTEARVRIHKALDKDISNRAEKYNATYPDMFRFYLLLGQVMFENLESSGQDIEGLIILNKSKGEKEENEK